MSIAEIRNLAKEYPAFRLQNVSFALEARRITDFIGRNGTGKTTTIKSMLNLVHPNGGEIIFFGMPLVRYNPDIIGYCWDDSNPRIQLEPRGNRGYIELRSVKKK